MVEDGSATSEVFTPRKSTLSRQAIEKNALRKTLGSSLSSEYLPIRQTDGRPSYSKDILNELKSSTPSTPRNLKSLSDEEDSPDQALDIASKFGTNLYSHQNPSIPTDAEIKEKKERRARLGKEQEFISLDSASASEDDDDDSVALRPRKKAAETRLVHDDEDIAEGFDSFVEDGRISLGKKAEREQKRRHQIEMREMIEEAEGTSSEGSDDSDAERRAEYEVAQTRKGMDGLHHYGQRNGPRRPRTPPKITPLPTLGVSLERLQARLGQMEYARGEKVREMELLEKEKVDVAIREEEIQRLLTETGERYESLREEAGIAAGQPAPLANSTLTGRGLESLGSNTIMGTTGE